MIGGTQEKMLEEDFFKIVLKEVSPSNAKNLQEFANNLRSCSKMSDCSSS
jgi:hypothetical protein